VGRLWVGVRASDEGRPRQVEPLRTDVGRDRMKKQYAERLADEESIYVPVSVAAVAALWVVHERGELRRCVFQSLR
jgi:hypothetical protein